MPLSISDIFITITSLIIDGMCMLQNAVPFVFNWGWMLLVDTLHITRVIFADMLTLTSTTGMLVASRLLFIIFILFHDIMR